MAFYEIARRANLTNHSDLIKSLAFQKAQNHGEARAKYLWEAFRSQEAINDYIKFHLEGALAGQGKSWEDAAGVCFLESLKRFPVSRRKPLENTFRKHLSPLKAEYTSTQTTSTSETSS